MTRERSVKPATAVPGRRLTRFCVGLGYLPGPGRQICSPF